MIDDGQTRNNPNFENSINYKYSDINYDDYQQYDEAYVSIISQT